MATNRDAQQPLCECGHPKSRHFMGVYNCGDCPGDEDCVMFKPAEPLREIRTANSHPNA